MNAKQDAERFYIDYVGCYPFKTNKERIMTEKMIEHFHESLNLEANDDLLFQIFENCARDGYIGLVNLPVFLYKDSLVEKDRFYYHSLLKVQSKAPVFDFVKNVMVTPDFYCEPREHFTIGNLLDYVYNKLDIPDFLRERHRDTKAIQYILGRYKTNPHVSALDFTLYMIDEASKDSKKISQIISINSYELQTADRVKRIVEIAKAKKYNQYIWRRGIVK